MDTQPPDANQGPHRSGWAEGWAEPSGIPKRKSVPGGEHTQGRAPGGKENVPTLTAASLQRRCRTCYWVPGGVTRWRASRGEGGPMGRGREEEKEEAEKTDTWGEDEECLEHIAPA